jgi:hypothetical protein
MSRPRIACGLCVGSADEPYLAATLASAAAVVDTLVVNDNSGEARSANRATIEASAFAAEGRLRVVERPFVDFARMRNDAHEVLVSLDPAPDWILFLDADEVHGEQLAYLARDVLPRLDAGIAHLDAYTFHFWGTFRWISDVARRMVFYRFAPQLRWENPVHEKLAGLGARSVVVPYVYHHYGNVLPPRMLAEKHQRYYGLGNAVPEPPQPGDATRETYLERAAEVRPYRGAHPHAAAETVARIEQEDAAEFALLDAGFEARRPPSVRAAGALRALNETLRVRLRALEHPGLYRAPLVAR